MRLVKRSQLCPQTHTNTLGLHRCTHGRSCRDVWGQTEAKLDELERRQRPHEARVLVVDERLGGSMFMLMLLWARQRVEWAATKGKPPIWSRWSTGSWCRRELHVPARARHASLNTLARADL